MYNLKQRWSLSKFESSRTLPVINKWRGSQNGRAGWALWFLKYIFKTIRFHPRRQLAQTTRARPLGRWVGKHPCILCITTPARCLCVWVCECVSLTLCKTCLSSSWLAEHRGAPHTQHYCLSMAKHRSDFIATCREERRGTVRGRGEAYCKQSHFRRKPTFELLLALSALEIMGFEMWHRISSRQKRPLSSPFEISQ